MWQLAIGGLVVVGAAAGVARVPDCQRRWPWHRWSGSGVLLTADVDWPGSAALAVVVPTGLLLRLG